MLMLKLIINHMRQPKLTARTLLRAKGSRERTIHDDDRKRNLGILLKETYARDCLNTVNETERVRPEPHRLRHSPTQSFYTT